jgi:S-adenosylmethionine-diacylglycerol 3-amino-3-carboxypropyl transferase
MSRGPLRYGQCWEDASCLLAALDPRPGAQLLSIASGGENSLALLSRPGVRVLAIDRSAPQIAALELKVAAFRHLAHAEMLQLLGAWPTDRRRRLCLYRRCRQDLSPAASRFWERDGRWLAWGVLPVARFERYLGLFRRLVLPLVHGPEACRKAVQSRDPQLRALWYDQHWDGWRWRCLFRLFFNRTLLGRLGTDPHFVRFGQGDQAEVLLAQVRRVMVESDPAHNPYLHWILLGRYGDTLPLALQAEQFAPIRSRLDQLRWRQISLEQWLAPGMRGATEKQPSSQADGVGEDDAAREGEGERIGGVNLSNVLEYVEAPRAGALLDALHRRMVPGARLLLWNRLADRSVALARAGSWRSLDRLAHDLGRRNAVPFYRRLVIAEALAASAPPSAPPLAPLAPVTPAAPPPLASAGSGD